MPSPRLCLRQHDAIWAAIGSGAGSLGPGLGWGASTLADLLPFPPHLLSFSTSLPQSSLSPPQRRSAPHARWAPSPTLPQGAKCKHTKARWCIVSPAPAARRALPGRAPGQGGAGGPGCQGAPWGRGRGQHLSPSHWGPCQPELSRDESAPEKQASLTPEPSGHCLLSSPEPLLGGINPFLTPVLRLGGVVPKGGDSVWGCQQAVSCPQQPCNRGTLGEPGSRGPGPGGTDRDFFLFHQLLQGEPPALLPSHH